MKTKLARRAAWIALIVVGAALLLAVAAPLLVSSEAVRRGVESRSAAWLDGPLRIQSLDVSWLGGLRISGLSLGNPSGFSGGPFVECQKATGGLALWPLLRGVVDLRTIRLEEPLILVERARDGRWNSDAIVKRRPGAATEAGGEAGDLPRLKARLEVRRGRVEFRDDLLGTRSDAAGIDADVSADLTAEEPAYGFRLSIPAISANQSMAPLLARLVAIVPPAGQRGELSGRLSIEGEGTMRGREPDALAASLDARGRLTLEEGVIGGSPLATRILELLGQPPSIEVRSLEARFRIADGAVEIERAELRGSRIDLSLSGKTTLDGRLDLRATARAKEGGDAGDARERIGRRLAGAVELQLAIGGTLAAPSVAAEGTGLRVDPEGILEKAAEEARKRLPGVKDRRKD